MKIQALLLAALLAAATPVAEPRYFTHVRDVTVADPSVQNYVVVDEEVWKRCRPDLGDIRLYAPNGQEVPYALRVQASGRTAASTPAKVLQLGTTAGRTTFFLDLEHVDEYDRVTLDLGRKDFVASARVEGRDELNGKSTALSSYTVYDFSREELGRNTVLKLPRSRFRYLRIELSAPLRPQDVQAATVANVQEQKASWTHYQMEPTIETWAARNTTVAHWRHDREVTLERIEFRLPAVTPEGCWSAEWCNFRRNVNVKDAADRVVASGQIGRVRLQREGKLVDREDLALEFPAARSKSFTVVVENGDDVALPFTAIVMQTVERRIYFAPRGQTTLKLYYGDPKLESPVYDFAKLFQAEANAATAQLSPGAHNAAYTPRPDDRPWTERHPAVLWSALVVAVVGLGLIALRGLKA